MDSSAKFEPQARESEQHREGLLEDNSLHASQDSEELIFCAGLPFVGRRVLTESDRAGLLKQRLRSTLLGACWLLASALAISAAISYLLSETADLAHEIGLVAIPLVIIFLFGVPVSVLKAKDALRRARHCDRTLTAASVRVFSGLLNVDDPSDVIRESLVRARLLSLESGKTNCIELHPCADVIYSINDVTPRDYLSVELTTAASAPTNPARFSMPFDWVTPSDRMDLTRRRLTSAERAELLNYANDVGSKAAFSVVLIFWFGGKALWQVLTKCLAPWPGLGETLSVAIIIGICTQLILRARRRAGELHLESETGWAVSIEPAEAGDQPDSRDPIIPAEVLSQSGLLWTVRGRPAGWRRAGAKRLLDRLRQTVLLK